MNLGVLEEIINSLNSDMYENEAIMSIVENHGDLLEVRGNGLASAITFLGFQIWSSENDERKEIEDSGEYEPLELFLTRQMQIILKSLSTLVVK